MNRHSAMWGRWIALILLVVTAAVSAAGAEGEIRELPVDLSGGAPYRETFKTNPDFYEDPTIRVERYRDLTNSDEYGRVHYFYCLVTIQSPTQLRTAAADPENFVRGLEATGSTMAKRMNAVLAMNGDFPNTRTKGEGSKYCLRQGKVFRDSVVETLDMLLIDEDGDFHVYPGGPELAELDKETIGGKKIINAFQFGPALVIDGEPVADEYVCDPAHSPWSANPETHTARMCIGQIDTLHYIVFTCWDGMNLAQLRNLVLSITPCRTLYVMDGGNSAQLIYLKGQINRDDNENGNGRKIQDILYFASAYFRDE